MSTSPTEDTVLIVDALHLRSLGVVALFDRLSRTRGIRLTSLSPDAAEEYVSSDAHCRMIIYDVGAASVAEPTNVERIRALKGHAPEAPLVILSDSDLREEVLSAFGMGAQGFLYTGTDTRLAVQALSFMLEGGSYFFAATQTKRDPCSHFSEDIARLPQEIPDDAAPGQPTEAPKDEAGMAPIHRSLTARQRLVLERLGFGLANKVIARQLGISERTVKVHVRQIMRKLGVANRTQVAIACANGAPVERSHARLHHD